MSTDRPTHHPVSEAFRRQALTPPPHPLGFVRPLPTIYGEGIIPPAYPVPAKVTGFPLEIFDMSAREAWARAGDE